jgi:hypothetical protein
MPPAGFETAVTASARTQTHALDRRHTMEALKLLINASLSSAYLVSLETKHT